MNYAIFLNTLIVAVVFVGMTVLANPLAILGLYFLRDLPYGLIVPSQNNSEEETDNGYNGSRPMGFTHSDN